MSDAPFKFQPWIDFAKTKRILLPIDEPPCRHCRNFSPRVKTDHYGNFDGVVLCTTPREMERDFSCFITRAEES